MSGFDYEQLAGKELSYNNLVDTESALSCVKQFKKPSCVIVKHANPCGVAETDKLSKSYDFAYKTDPTSAFGGIIAFNKKVDPKLVKKIISQQFVEVIAAPAFDKECIDIIKIKPNIRLLLINNFNVKKKEIEIKSLKNKMLIQESDSINITERDLKKVTIKKPTKTQIADLLFAFKVSRYVKSNSIVFAKNGRTLGIGAGQMSRIDSTNIAKTKAKNHGLSLKGCVMASEAFFPFRDNVDLAKKIGVTAIIQPGGSISDKDIIDVANKHKMSMVLSGIRVFKH
jgi:phosphoribosylaminoimidazolecarboxamide formyltransferase/IMP cyclohydrolase